MNPLLYFAVKFFPFWGPLSGLLVVFPLAIKLFRRRRYFTSSLLFVVLLAVIYLTYLYVIKDGYHNAVPMVRMWIGAD